MDGSTQPAFMSFSLLTRVALMSWCLLFNRARACLRACVRAFVLRWVQSRAGTAVAVAHTETVESAQFFNRRPVCIYSTDAKCVAVVNHIYAYMPCTHDCTTSKAAARVFLCRMQLFHTTRPHTHRHHAEFLAGNSNVTVPHRSPPGAPVRAKKASQPVPRSFVRSSVRAVWNLARTNVSNRHVGVDSCLLYTSPSPRDRG